MTEFASAHLATSAKSVIPGQIEVSLNSGPTSCGDLVMSM